MRSKRRLAIGVGMNEEDYTALAFLIWAALLLMVVAKGIFL